MDNKEKSPLAALLKKPVQASIDVPVKAQPKQKPESQKTPIEKDVTTIKKDVAEVKKNTKVLADIAKKSEKQASRAKPVAAVIPLKDQPLTGDLNADILKVLSSIDKKLSADAAQSKKSESEKGTGPGPLASLIDTLGDIFGGGRGRPGAPPRAPTPTPPAPAPQAPRAPTPTPPAPAPQAPAPSTPKPGPGPVGQALSKVGEVAVQAARVAAPYAAPAAIAAAPFVATRAQIEKIKADPNAPGLESNPLAQTLRGEAETVGQAGRRNRDRAVGQVFSNTIQAAIDSDLSDEELYDQYGRDRKQLKEWVAKSKPGQTYDINTSAPAVASRQAESIIGVETPAQTPPELETGAPPPITGMESAFVPTPPTPPPAQQIPPAEGRVESSFTGVTPQDREDAKKRGLRGESGAQSEATARVARRQVQVQDALSEVNNAPPISKPRKPKDEFEQMRDQGKQVRQAAEAEGADPNKAKGIFEGGHLTKIVVDEKEIDVSHRLTPDQQKTVNAARKMRQAMEGGSEQQPAAQAQPQPQVTPAKEETGPVSGTERAIMQMEGLDPDNEFDRKLYRRRSQIQSQTPASQGTDLNRISAENNDLSRQTGSGQAQPIVINNNTSTATQTNVPVPAQPRVDSSFSRYGQSRASYW